MSIDRDADDRGTIRSKHRSLIICLSRWRASIGPPAIAIAGAFGIALGASFLGWLVPVHAQEVFQSERHSFRLVRIADGLDHPWSLAFLPDARIMVTERRGRLRLVERGRLVRKVVAGLPGNVTQDGQGGLLDVVLHPNFAANHLLYLSYAGRAGGRLGTEVVRAVLAGDRLTDVTVIFRALPKSSGGRHFGSRLLISDDGFLYITLGDRAERRSAQDLSDHRGSVIRIHVDGSVPRDNPFASKSGARPEIFTRGNRNVQGIARQPGSGLVWMHEHGPRGGDEINIIKAGANYGWPIVSYGINYDGSTISSQPTHPGVEPPVHYWVPSIAPSGMAFYDGDKFPNWRGNLLVGALKDRLLVRLEVDGRKIVHEERLLRRKLGRIRDVRQGPDGFIYLLNDSSRGAIYRLEPAD